MAITEISFAMVLVYHWKNFGGHLRGRTSEGKCEAEISTAPKKKAAGAHVAWSLAGS